MTLFGRGQDFIRHQRIGERLKHETEVMAGALVRHLPDEGLDLPGGRRIGVVVHQQFNHAGAHAFGLLHAPAWQDLALPGGRLAAITGRFDRHHKGDTPGQDAYGNRLGGTEFRIKQHSRGRPRQGGDDIQLEACQVEVSDGSGGGRVKGPPQVLAMVEGQAGKGGTI